MTHGTDARNCAIPRSVIAVGTVRPRPAGVVPPGPAPSPAVIPSSRPASVTDLTKVSIYLDEPTDTFLETVRTAARFATPRVDATRSAVVRLALNRLAEQLNHGELIAELQRNAANHMGPGRKRA